MSDLQDFLNEMKEEGKQFSSSGSLGVVSKVLVEFGLHRFVEGHDFWEFWTPVESAKEIKPKGAELAAKLKAAGSTETPSFGVRVTVRKDTLSANAPYKRDLVEFVPQWQSDAFALVEKHLVEADVPIGAEFYGQVKYLANPYHVAKGEAGKTEEDADGNPRYPSLRIPVKKFASETEARAFVEANGSAAAAPKSPFSEKAMASYTVQALQDSAKEIFEWLGKAKQGIAFNNDEKNFPLPKPATPPALKAYIAGIYQIEPTDIDLLQVDVPFG